MIPKLTDDAVSRLPLRAGRAELLEEIMSTVAPDRTEPTTAAPGRSSRRWLAPLAAAAVVAGIAGSSLWWTDSEAPPSPSPSGPTGARGAEPTSSGPATRAILDAPGWRVDSVESVEDGSGYSGVSYSSGDADFEITRYAASSYEGYVEDREHIVDPPAPGDPVEVLGRAGQLWAYSAGDHTVIREVEDGSWMEFRGAGMNRAAFVALLGELRLVDDDDFEASLPDRFVTSEERRSTAQDMLRLIERASGAEFPADFDDSARALVSDQTDPYQLGVHVVGTYACAWLMEYETATDAGDSARAQVAVDVLATSPQWPVLDQMLETGEYPQVIWGYADQVAAGQVPEGYADGLGCAR